MLGLIAFRAEQGTNTISAYRLQNLAFAEFASLAVTFGTNVRFTDFALNTGRIGTTTRITSLVHDFFLEGKLTG